MIKKIEFFLLIFLVLFFINKIILGDVNAQRPLSQEEQREKALGIERSDRDSKPILRQNFIKNIELGNIENIQTYIEGDKTSLNFVTINGINPFVHAANLNNLQIIKLFLETTNVDINIEDQFGNTGLIKAAEKGHIEIVVYLINNGADINYQNNVGMTAIMKSAEKNHFYVLKILLENNADIEKSDFTGRTLREIAKNSRDKRIFKLLN